VFFCEVTTDFYARSQPYEMPTKDAYPLSVCSQEITPQPTNDNNNKVKLSP
jgi:hypothetical protein